MPKYSAIVERQRRILRKRGVRVRYDALESLAIRFDRLALRAEFADWNGMGYIQRLQREVNSHG